MSHNDTNANAGGSSSSNSDAASRTPINNYAAPHTPIASAKRPRAQSNRNLMRSQSSTASASSLATETPKESSKKTPPNKNSDVEEGKENFHQQHSNYADELGGTDGVDEHPPAPVADSVNVQMSPMHPPRPVKRRDDESESNAPDGDNRQAEAKGETGKTGQVSEASGQSGTGGWKSKVDQLFSPVLNFLGGGSNGATAATAESHSASLPEVSLDADGDVTMIPVEENEHNDASKEVQRGLQLDVDTMSNATTATISHSTTREEDSSVPSVATCTTDFSLHQNQQPGAPREDPALQNQPEHDDVEDNHHHNNDSYDDYNEVDDEDIENDDEAGEEEEFNPYLFIKSLPPYSQVVPDPSLKICLPPKLSADPPISLVLDLDETLVHCTVEPTPNADMIFPVVFNGVEYRVHVRTRPYLSQFLEMVSSKFEVIVFTASQQVYADELLDRIDPGRKHIKHRMFRESCLPVEGNYLKDLNVLGRDLRKAVLVDNSPHAFGYQVDNGIPIESWFDDPHDTELLKLERFLRTLHETNDVRDAVRAKFQTYKLIMNA